MPPSSVSGAAPWQWLWQRVGASKWPPAPRRQFTKHVDLRAATFGCGSSFLAVLDPSAAFPAVLRARSAVVFAGLRLVVGVWAETRQILWVWCVWGSSPLPLEPSDRAASVSPRASVPLLRLYVRLCQGPCCWLQALPAAQQARVCAEPRPNQSTDGSARLGFAAAFSIHGGSGP